MAHPMFGQILAELQADPASVMKKAEEIPELKEIVMLLLGTLGSHFNNMAAKQPPAPPPAPAPAPAPVVDPQVQNVLENPELLAILQDPEMKRVLQECGKPGVLRHFMNHPKFGPKLRMMAKAGLVQIHPS